MNLKSREIKLRCNALRQGLFAHKGKDVYGVSGWMFTDLDNVIVAGLCPWTAYAMDLGEAEAFIVDGCIDMGGNDNNE